MENKVYKHIFNDILEKVLNLSDNPSQFAEYLTQQIRELVGARTIVISIKSATGLPQIFSVFPTRRTEWAQKSTVLDLAEISFSFKEIQYLDQQNSEDAIAIILKKLELEKVIVIPLIAANQLVGSLLLLDMMDLFGIESVLDLLTQLSGVFALVIRNAHLYQNMEDLVATRTQELLVAKERAEESDRLKSAFLANMSHEIRTPMNGILGFAELLKEPNLSGEQQQKYIQIIEKSGDRMLNIINEIIDISRIESGLMNVDLCECNVNTQLNELMNFFQPEAEAKGLELYIQCPLPTEKAFFQTDRDKLNAILTNLIKNALKFTQNGSIRMGYKLNSIDSTTIKQELVFFVSDTGMGIPPDRQEAVFERFIHADIENKKAMQGAGLGLAISKSFVTMLGGRIWVESAVDKGSTFYFALPNLGDPIKTVLMPKAENTSKSLMLDNKVKFLIVDDDETSSLFLSTVLSKHAQKILKAFDGEEAVSLSRQHPDIDVILMDMQMPKMGGVEATRQIRQFNKDVIIIAQTAFGLAGDREKTIEAGCNDYISKPINSSLLFEIILKYFN